MYDIIINILILTASFLLLVYIFQKAYSKIEGVENMNSSTETTPPKNPNAAQTDWPLNIYFSIDEQNELSNIPEEPPSEKDDKLQDLLNELQSDPNFAPVNIDDLANLPMREFAIKGAYNAAYDGKAFTLAQLGKIMASGCRYLDMQLFLSNNILYVGHSQTPRVASVETSLTFSEVLGYVSQYAFTVDNKIMNPFMDSQEELKKKNEETTINDGAPTLQNTYTKYPLFLNLRINRPQNSNEDIVEIIYTKYLNPDSPDTIVPTDFLYRQNDIALKIDKDTPINQLERKIVFVMDIDNILQNYTTTFNAEDVPLNTRRYLNKFVNVKTGGHTWKTYNNYDNVEVQCNKLPLYVKDNGLHTNVNNLYMVLPSDGNSGNPDYQKYVMNYRIQNAPNRFYIEDNNLKKYNDMFDAMKRPFVPMAYVARYIKNTMAVENKQNVK